MHKRILILATLFISTVAIAANLPETPRTFKAAKQLVYRIDKGRRTLYCGCKFTRKKVDLKSCGYVPRKNKYRARRTEIEHVVTAWQIGHSRTCWREPICVKKNGKRYKGRKCCEKIDPVFRKAHNDPRNLFVVIGEVNGDRNNYRYAMLQEEPNQYGACQSVTDFKGKKFMPRIEARGIVARASLYMHKTYDIPLASSQRKLFEAWDKQYPAGEWERARSEKLGGYLTP